MPSKELKEKSIGKLLPTRSQEYRDKNNTLLPNKKTRDNESELRNARPGNDKSPPDSSKEKYFYISLHSLSIRSRDVDRLNDNVSYIVSSDHGISTICGGLVEKNILSYFNENGHEKAKILFNGGLDKFVKDIGANKKISKEYHKDYRGNTGQLNFTYRKLLYDLNFGFQKMYLNNPRDGGIYEIDENGISTGYTGWRAKNITSYILHKGIEKGKPRLFERLKLSEIIQYLREKPGYETQKYHFLILSCRSTDGYIGMERTWTDRERPQTICDKIGNCFRYMTGRKKTKRKKKKQYKKKKKESKHEKKKGKQYKKKKYTKIKTLKRK
jgi:hypothetical protein